MNLVKYVGQQFGKPTGIGGKLSTFVMNRMNQKQYNAVIKSLSLSSQDTVLDVGFGNGYLINKLAKQNDCKFCGIEVSDDMINAARKRNRTFIEQNRVNVLKGDVVSLPFDSGSFSKVYTVNTVYFWSDLDKGLTEIGRVLKPSGVFINAIYTKHFLDKFRYTQYGFAKYTLPELEAAAIRNNFQLVSTTEVMPNDAYCFVMRKK